MSVRPGWRRLYRGLRAVAHGGGARGFAAVVVERVPGHAIEVARSQRHVLVEPLDVPLLAEAVAVVDGDGRHLAEVGWAGLAGRPLDREAAEVVHLVAAAVAEGTE